MFTLVQTSNGNATLKATGDSVAAGVVKVEFAPNIDAEIGRGEVDKDRTYIALRRSDGTKVYLYVDTGTTLTVSATKP